MHTELDLLNEKNTILNEQVKLLIRTEKQLYRAHKNSEKHLNLIRSLSEFSLRCSNEIEVNVILSSAMDLLCSLYPFDMGAAAIIDSELNILHFSSFEKEKSPTSSSFDLSRAD